MQEEFILPGYDLTSPKNVERRMKAVEKGLLLAKSWKNDFKKSKVLDIIENQIPILSIIESENNVKWKKKKLGLNTVADSANLIFLIHYIMKYFNYHIDIEEMINETIEKKYSLWKLEYRTREFGEEKISFEFLKNEFVDDEQIRKCKNLKEIYKNAGYPVGIGVSEFLLDDVIHKFSQKRKNNELYRIDSIGKILKNISEGIPVPIQVKNSEYFGNFSKNSSKYLLLMGMSKGIATFIDTSIGYSIGKPIRIIFDDLIAFDGIISAWDCSSLLHNKIN